MIDKILIDVPEKIITPRLALYMPQAGFGKKLKMAIDEGYDDYIKWLDWPDTPPTEEECEKECRQNHASFITREFMRYLVFEKESMTLIGRSGYPPFQANWSIPQFGVGYFIRHSFRKKGFASEATLALSHMAFDFLHAKKIEIYCDRDNISSTKVPEKIGFKLEYTQKGGWPKENEALAILDTYSIFSKEELNPLDLHYE